METEGVSPVNPAECQHRWVIEGHGETHTETCRLCFSHKTVTAKPFKLSGNPTPSVNPDRKAGQGSREKIARLLESVKLRMQGYSNEQITEMTGISSQTTTNNLKIFVGVLGTTAPNERMALHLAIQKAVRLEQMPIPFIPDTHPEINEADRIILDSYASGVTIGDMASGAHRDKNFISERCTIILEMTGVANSLGLAGWVGREQLNIRKNPQQQ